ncbi:MAG: LD-carboxypeptidase [Bacteroidetes bacterium]|nr:MAG: LD-carboxypeptidase [Bacteroidota bacterium]
MIIPPLLEKGDTVKIISTARKIEKEVIYDARKLLESKGLKVEFGKNLFSEHHQFAGTDRQRAEDLQEAVENPNVKAIFCARGGYGTIKLMNKVSLESLKKQPKWLVGYSDVTVLHNCLNNLGIASLHATMPVNYSGNTSGALNSLFQAFFSGQYQYEILPDTKNRSGICEGELTGGNLSIIYSLLGTKFDISTENKILFIEDLDEYLYHVDRMMAALYYSGKLQKLKGLIVGGMTDMNDNEIPFGKTAEEIILEYVSEFDYPVVFNFPAGHITDNRALILGKKHLLKVSDNSVILQTL